MTPEFLAAAPQMSDYLAETQVYLPYVMHFQRPNVRRAAFTTDEHGFRRTSWPDGRVLSLEEFNALPAAARPRALVGNSTAFGVGSTADDRSIAGRLNRLEAGAWFNFAGRTLNPLQELLAFLLFCRARVDAVAVMSGINLLDMSYRFASPLHESVPPFYLERGLLHRLGRVPRRTLRGWLAEGWRRVRGRALPDPLVGSAALRELERGLADVETLVAEPLNAARALAHMRHVLALWAALRPSRAAAILFVIQPVPDWFGRPFTEVEGRLTSISESHRPAAWRRVRASIEERAPAFKRDLIAACLAHRIPVLDLNTLPELLELEWVFLDRYHLTDAAQERIAGAIAAALPGPARPEDATSP
jgi:hypothetical protein